MLRFHGRSVAAVPSSAFAGFRFPPEIIVLAVRWYLRFGLSYRDVEELLVERGIEVDHVTVYRWVQRFTPFLADAARPCRHAVGDRWFVDETYVKVAGRWRFVYRAVDQHGQIIDVYVSARRDTRAARRFFATAIGVHGAPTEVVTDRAWTLLTVVDELMPGAFHNTEQYANNRIEADHGRLKSRLRPMRGLKHDHSARVIMRGHAFMQNLRRGHYELGIDARPSARRGRVHRTRPSHLTGNGPQLGLARSGPTQRNSTLDMADLPGLHTATTLCALGLSTDAVVRGLMDETRSDLRRGHAQRERGLGCAVACAGLNRVLRPTALSRCPNLRSVRARVRAVR
jgi:transposase-like protein